MLTQASPRATAMPTEWHNLEWKAVTNILSWAALARHLISPHRNPSCFPREI